MLSDLVAGRRATTIPDVVDIMMGLDRSLPDADGLKWFNRLYLQVTLAVRDEVKTTTYRDPAFLETLDVVFANLYFDAVATGNSDPGRAPSAWRPLFECRRQRGIRPLQFALAGMNAHINRDLPEGACGDVDDAIAMWKVRAARAAAWTNARVLWALRPTPALRNAFFSRLDSLTGFAGRGLLLPTAPLTDRKRGAYADD